EGEYPEDNIISRNTIINCTKFGVLVEADSEGNLIQNNDFFDSGESCHICDDGTGTMIQDNFYDIWSLPDADADGTVDIPYTILGLAGNSDPTPEAEPVNAIPEDYNYVPMTPTQPGDIDIDLGIIMIGAGIGVVVCLLAIVVVKKR
ncbi:MAG: NosD domain-containing protein, partial [Candidatus Thorarchaeota archaeon]